jgi:MFS superfamily sulfate permease-like transporter
MSRRWQMFVAGFVVAIVLWILPIPWWIPLLVVLAALSVPVVGWMMLDPSQRRRIRRMRDRGQLGR